MTWAFQKLQASPLFVKESGAIKKAVATWKTSGRTGLFTTFGHPTQKRIVQNTGRNMIDSTARNSKACRCVIHQTHAKRRYFSNGFGPMEGQYRRRRHG